MTTMLKRRSEKKGLNSCGQSQRPPAHDVLASEAGSARAAGNVSRGPGSSASRRSAGVKRGLAPAEPGRSSAAYATRAARDWRMPEAELSEYTSARSWAGAAAARVRAAAAASPSRRAVTRRASGSTGRGAWAARGRDAATSPRGVGDAATWWETAGARALGGAPVHSTHPRIAGRSPAPVRPYTMQRHSSSG